MENDKKWLNSKRKTLCEHYKISNSDICVSQGDLQQKFGVMVISGNSFNIIEDSNLYGDLVVLEYSRIFGSTIFGNNTDLFHVNITRSNLSGMVSAQYSHITDSTIRGLEQSSVPHEKMMLYLATIESNSNVSGIGLINGRISNGSFNGSGSFTDEYGNIFMLHLFGTGSILSGGVASGNGWIAGYIMNGGVGNFSGSLYWHSGVHLGAGIGANGQANCYSYVRSGTLNKSICNQAYWGGRTPDTMDLDVWIEYEQWPSY